MKTSFALGCLLLTASSSLAQGTINFFNNNLTGPNGTYRAGIFRSEDPITGTIGAGAGFTAGLFLASNLNAPLATTTFRTTTAQEVFAQTIPDVIVPGVPPGSTAQLIVRAWETSAGSFANSIIRGEQAFTSRPLGGPNPDPTQPAIPSPDIGPGFTGFVMVPEPSTISALVIGAGVLMFSRRKSKQSNP